MHVKIVKSSSKDYWYNDSIGDRFDISGSGEQLTNDVIKDSLFQGSGFPKCILINDCEILHLDGECDCREKFGLKIRTRFELLKEENQVL